VLSLNPIALNAFDVHDPAPSEVMLVPATLRYQGFVQEQFFQLTVEDNRWKVVASWQTQDPAVDPSDAVSKFLLAARYDRGMQPNHATFYLGGRLRELVQNGQITDVGAIVQEQYAYSDFTIDRVLASDGDQVYIEATLFYGQGESGKRIFTVSNREEGTWRIFKVVITDGADDPGTNNPPPDADWYELARGDFNGDGLEERVLVVPAYVTPQDNFFDAYLRDQAIVVARMRVEQAGAEGPWTMLIADSESVRADKLLGSFRSPASPDGPAAFLLAIDPDGVSRFNLLPLKADGHAYTQSIGLSWNADVSGYRIDGPHGTL
jgi:hypothetical protein